ncbi:hypothetical protein ENHYD8BJ_150023 [Enhydrobacter sp. 8BJ]|nr:hypothetical protein ENHYD8BJ_150023 [Enhydrobacter sp. 8BJ]
MLLPKPQYGNNLLANEAKIGFRILEPVHNLFNNKAMKARLVN